MASNFVYDHNCLEERQSETEVNLLDLDFDGRPETEAIQEYSTAATSVIYSKQRKNLLFRTSTTLLSKQMREEIMETKMMI